MSNNKYDDYNSYYYQQYYRSAKHLPSDQESSLVQQAQAWANWQQYEQRYDRSDYQSSQDSYTNPPPPPPVPLPHRSSPPLPPHRSSPPPPPPPDNWATSPDMLVMPPPPRPPSPKHYYNRMNNKGYASQRGEMRFHNNGRQQSWTRGKKRKKSVCQLPLQKNYTREEAEKALKVEREYKEKFRKFSLVVKFPDEELNSQIVTKFHPEIVGVHFAQSSCPRVCFINLKPTADPEAIIEHLNKQPFGQGFLKAEYKIDRQDEVITNPDDIDPTTLYVGNLPKEFTEEQVSRLFPTNKLINIGHTLQMHRTMYAFVTFYTVEDAIEAYKSTLGTQVNGLSLILRFKRYNGGKQSKGDKKKQPEAAVQEEKVVSGSSEHTTNGENAPDTDDQPEVIECKREPDDYSDEDDEDLQCGVLEAEDEFAFHPVKCEDRDEFGDPRERKYSEIKRERIVDDDDDDDYYEFGSNRVKVENGDQDEDVKPNVKEEPWDQEAIKQIVAAAERNHEIDEEEGGIRSYKEYCRTLFANSKG